MGCRSSVLRENWSKERREDRTDHHITYFLYPESLIQSSGAGQECWKLNNQENTSSVGNIEVLAELKKTNCLCVEGAVSMSELTPGLFYEVVYVVKLKSGGYGWEHPVTLTLSVPGEGTKCRLVNLYERPKGEWIELNVGKFQTRPGETRQVSFGLLQKGAHDKKGLVLKSAVLRPNS